MRRSTGFLFTLFLWPLSASTETVHVYRVARKCEHILFRLRTEPPFAPPQIAQWIRKTDAFWSMEFMSRGLPYQPVRFKIHYGDEQSACGPVEMGSGPAYCFSDGTLYIDPYYFAENASSLGDPSGPLLAYVLTHEIGHHVQKQRNAHVRGRLLSQLRHATESDSYFGSHLEFQADCLAGVALWHFFKTWTLSKPELLESIARVSVMGDDEQERIAEQLGRKTVITYAHGTSRKRMAWLLDGMLDPRLERCEPFDLRTLD